MKIKEFLPNPVGSDKEGEYIKLFNNGQQPISLSGWFIKDASGKTFKLSGELGAGQELILKSLETKISLNNNGEQIFLYDNFGKLVDKLSYSGQASEGQVITKQQITTIDNKTTTDILDSNINSITNYSITNFLFLDFLTAAILAALSLYIILELEKKLEIELF